MLQAIRNQVGSWVVKILLALLIVAFAIWGINDIFLGDRDPAVVEVGEIKVPRSEVEEAVRREVSRMSSTFGSRINTDEALRNAITANVIERSVSQAALRLAARDFGITVSDQRVAWEIRRDPAFAGTGGEFDRQAYFSALAQARLSEAAYVAQLKEDILVQRFDRAATSYIPLPDALVDPMTRHQAEQRSADWINVPFPAKSAIADPSPEALKEFYEANQNRFMAPERRDLTVLHLSPEIMAQEVNVSEDQLRRAYDQQRDQFATPERRQISQAVFQSETAAAAVARAARNNQPLADAVRESAESVSAVDLGWVTRDDLVAGLLDPVFNADAGEIVGPVQTVLGWHVIAVRDATPGSLRTFDEVRDELRLQIAMREAMDSIFPMLNELEDALAAGESLQQAAERLNLPVRRIDGITRRGLTAGGEDVEGLPQGSEFLRTAFDLEEGEVSPLVETGTGGFFALRVNKVTPATPRPLDSARQNVIDAWKAERQEAAAEARAQTIADRLKAGDSLAAIAAEAGFEVRSVTGFSRDGQDAGDLPREMVRKLFDIRAGDVAMARAENGMAVAVLVDIVLPPRERRNAIAERMTEQTRESMAGDLFNQLIGALRARADIQIRPGLIQGSR